MLSLHNVNGETQQLPISPVLSETGQAVGYELRGPERRLRWLPVPTSTPEPPHSTSTDLPETLVGEWGVVTYGENSDGDTVAIVKVSADGSLRLQKIGSDESVEGKLTLSSEGFEMRFDGQERPYSGGYQMTPDKIRYGNRETDDFYQEWQKIVR